MKKKTVELLVNFSKLKEKNEELFSLGEKLLKAIVKEVKTFLPQNVVKLFKINTASIEKDLKEIDTSKFNGFILDPYTLSQLEKKEKIDVLLFDPLRSGPPLDLTFHIYGIFDLQMKDTLEKRYTFLRRFVNFIISLMKDEGIYREEDFVYTFSGSPYFPYFSEEKGLGFINSLKNVFSEIKEREGELRDIQQKYKLYTYKLREKLVIKDKQRRQKEIIESLFTYSNELSQLFSPFPSILFIYNTPLERDVFREWFLKEFLSFNLPDIPCNFISPFSSEDGRDVFGYIPSISRNEEFITGEIFQSQGEIAILEDVPSSTDFFERLLFYTNSSKVLPYGERVEIFSPAPFIVFLDSEKFERFKEYISFSYIFRLPSLFSQEEITSFVSTALYLYSKGKEEIRITYEALFFLEDAVHKYGMLPVLFSLRSILSRMDSSKILRKELLQDFLSRL